MRPVILLGVASLLLFSPFVSSARGETARVARPGAEIRADIGFAGAALLAPAPETLVEVLERRSEWVRVRAADGREGWIHELFLARVEAVAAPAPAAPAVAAPVEPVVPSVAIEAARPATPEPDETEALRSRVAELGSELNEVSAERAYLAGKLRSMTGAEQDLRDRLADALAERDAARQSALETSARLDADSAGSCREALAEAVAGRAEADARHARELEDARVHHERVMEQFIDVVTKRHDDALARETAAIEAECQRMLVEERRVHERDLKVARREGGYEAQLMKELRARLDTEVEEARTRWEAKQRGEMYDVERARREEGERVRTECEGQRLAAVNAAVAQGAAEKAAALANERQEADLRCQVALELILQRAAEGGDMTKVREMAERAARRRTGEPQDPASATEAQGVEPATPAIPAPVPVPWTRPKDPPP